MTFASLAGPLLEGACPQARELFARAAGLRDTLMPPGLGQYIESSLKSSAPEELKVLLFFNYQGRAPADASAVVDAARLVSFLREAPGLGEAAADVAREALRVPLRSGGDNDFVGLSLDIDAARGRWRKLTLYLNPADEAAAGALAGLAGVPAPREAARLYGLPDFAALDLEAGGAWSYKWYVGARWPRRPEELKALQALSSLGEPSFLATLRFAPDGTVAEALAQYAVAGRLDCASAARLEPFAAFAPFLERAGRAIGGATVSWLALKEGGRALEVYFELR